MGHESLIGCDVSNQVIFDDIGDCLSRREVRLIRIGDKRVFIIKNSSASHGADDAKKLDKMCSVQLEFYQNVVQDCSPARYRPIAGSALLSDQ